MLAFATVARKSFNSKLITKIHFPPVTITNADKRSLKFRRTLFDKYMNHGEMVKFEQNRMVRNIQNFEHFGKKWLTIFEKVLTPFWKTFL